LTKAVRWWLLAISQNGEGRYGGRYGELKTAFRGAILANSFSKEGGLLKRGDGRAFDAIRTVKITPGFQSFAEGSALIEMGQTRVLTAVTIEDRVPPFLKGRGTGWLTAEYSMLPRSTPTRNIRDGVTGRIAGRSQEIQRLIGRSLRAAVDLPKLGERTIIIDCDVLQADGGTRTAAITGAYVALCQALQNLRGMGIITTIPLRCAVAATSAGIVRGNYLLDLAYDEDSAADVDFNVVMTDGGLLVEVQGTAEARPYKKEDIDVILALTEKGIKELFTAQQKALESLNIVKTGRPG
jgi:ribonuclease PH